MIPANELRPHFEGDRFQNHTLPLEFSSDLEGLQKIVLEVAKWHYMRDHKRSRFRKGLAADFQLHLIKIEEGSTVPVLGIIRPQLELDIVNGLFTKTIATINELVAGFGRSETWQLPADFPAEAMRLFEQFGRSLRDSEWINLGTKEITVRYDQKVRSRILAKIPAPRMSRKTLRGSLVEFDRDAQTFQIRTSDGKVTGKISDAHYRRLLDIFSHERRLVVEVNGLCVHNSRDKTTRLERLDRVDVLDTERMRERLSELGAMCPDWLSDEPRSKDTLFADFFSVWESLVSVLVPTPNLFPIERHGLEAEWNAGPKHVSIEISMADLHGVLTFFDDETEEFRETTINLFHEETWELLNREVLSIFGGHGR